MRTSSRLGYAERIERAVALLERNAAEGETTSLTDLASAAALSPFHFHRVYRVMTGEPIGDLLARVRLGVAIPLLDRAILDATAQSGYATSQAFARALKNRIGATPSELRDDPDRRQQAEEALMRPFHAQTTPPPIRIEIASVAPLRLTAIRNVGDYAELNQGFERLMDLVMGQVGPDDIAGLYGVPHDDPRETRPQDCRFDCAVSTTEAFTPEDPLQVIEFPGGSALRLVHCGDYDAIHDVADALYREAVEGDLPITDAPLLIHYLHDPEVAPVEQLVAHVFLRVETSS